MEFALEFENLEFNLEFRRLDVLGITAQKLRSNSERGSRTYKSYRFDSELPTSESCRITRSGTRSLDSDLARLTSRERRSSRRRRRR